MDAVITIVVILAGVAVGAGGLCFALDVSGVAERLAAWHRSRGPEFWGWGARVKASWRPQTAGGVRLVGGRFAVVGLAIVVAAVVSPFTLYG